MRDKNCGTDTYIILSLQNYVKSILVKLRKPTATNLTISESVDFSADQILQFSQGEVAHIEIQIS